MSLAAISAVIAVIVSLAGLIIQLVAVGIYIGKLEGFKELVNYKFNEQKDRLDKHNNFISRLYEVEKKEAVLEEQVEETKHKIAGFGGM